MQKYRCTSNSAANLARLIELRRTYRAALPVLLAVLAACAPPQTPHFNDFVSGMTRAELSRVFGEPLRKEVFALTYLSSLVPLELYQSEIPPRYDDYFRRHLELVDAAFPELEKYWTTSLQIRSPFPGTRPQPELEADSTSGQPQQPDSITTPVATRQSDTGYCDRH